VRGFVAGYYLDVLDVPVGIQAGRAVLPGRPGLGVALQSGFTDRAGVTIRRSALRMRMYPPQVSAPEGET
jgi:hypothetical protein